jgi:5S rRNA maturation endonuclease (ribonuclease M5)
LSAQGERLAKQLKVSINDEAHAFVEETAMKDSVSEPDIVRKALQAYRYLREVRSADGEIVLRRADGAFERLMNV